RHVRELLRDPRMRTARALPVQDADRGEKRSVRLHRGFYNPRRRHSSIEYLSPIDYEHRHHAATVDRDAPQPAAVLAAVEDKPFGRPQQAAVLDRHCARQPRKCAGRDGRMAPPGGEKKNATKTKEILQKY